MTFKSLSILLLSVFMVSCGGSGAGPKATSTKAEKRGKQALSPSDLQNASAAANGRNKPQGSSWGRVYLDESYQSGQAAFQEQVVLLLEPQFKREEVGSVNGIDDRSKPQQEQQNTGVAFWAKGLQLTGGLNPNKTDYTEQEDIFNVNEAVFRMSIYQGKENKDNSSIVDIEEVPIHFNDGERGEDSGKLVDSYINGNYIQLIFADSFGKISLSGRFDKDLFKGQVHFLTQQIDPENTGTPESVSRTPQLLGKFEVNTCGFFNCSN